MQSDKSCFFLFARSASYFTLPLPSIPPTPLLALANTHPHTQSAYPGADRQINRRTDRLPDGRSRIWSPKEAAGSLCPGVCAQETPSIPVLSSHFCSVSPKADFILPFFVSSLSLSNALLLYLFISLSLSAPVSLHLPLGCQPNHCRFCRACRNVSDAGEQGCTLIYLLLVRRGFICLHGSRFSISGDSESCVSARSGQQVLHLVISLRE